VSEISSDESILIEYLDGELSIEAKREIEDRLSREPELRALLAQLEQDWSSLDLLERAGTDKQLVATTLETIIASVEHKKTATRPKFYVVRLCLLLLFVVSVFFFSFQFGERLAPDDNFMLRVESPVIERLDQYLMLLDIDSDLSLLRLLAERRVFLPPLAEGAVKSDASEFLPSSNVKISDAFSLYPSFSELKRRAVKLENLDKTLYNRFYWNNKRFRQLTFEKRHQLRQIHENIESSPRRRELFSTLRNYYNWFKSLQTYEKAAIRRPNISLADRVDLIAALKKQLDADQPGNVAANASLPSTVMMVQEENNIKKLADSLTKLDNQNRDKILDSPPDLILETLGKIEQQEKKN
jgi:hypothetical protein